MLKPEQISVEVVERRDDPGVWSVEAINTDGSIEVALFPGPNSKDRATEYAAWRYGLAEAADTITALRAEVASKNDEFQKYARRMEADMNELGGENARLTARIRELEGALKQIDIGFVRAKDAPAMHDEAIRIARAALLPSAHEIAAFSAAQAPLGAENEKLRAALEEMVNAAAEHHAENVSRAELGGSDMAQRKAKAIVARSGVLFHNIKAIVRAALEEKQ